MFRLSDITPPKTSRPTIKPGTYSAQVCDIVNSEKYVDGDAFIVKYKLYDIKGEYVTDFRETFLNTTENARTMELVKLMEELCVESADDLIDQIVRVEIRYRVTDYGGRLPSIVKRTPILPPSPPPSNSSQEAS